MSLDGHQSREAEEAPPDEFKDAQTLLIAGELGSVDLRKVIEDVMNLRYPIGKRRFENAQRYERQRTGLLERMNDLNAEAKAVTSYGPRYEEVHSKIESFTQLLFAEWKDRTKAAQIQSE